MFDRFFSEKGVVKSFDLFYICVLNYSVRLSFCKPTGTQIDKIKSRFAKTQLTIPEKNEVIRVSFPNVR